jgi:hypothetical protein
VILITTALLQGPLASPAEGDDFSPEESLPLDAGWRSAIHLLGGFRPLAVDFLWLRADAMHRQGRLWELAALFRGITALDPRNRLVREYAAWHLAYNVALTEPDPEQRFVWFREGVEILESSQFRGRDAWRLRVAGGRMFIDRFDSGVFPGFEAKVAARWGGDPLIVAARWLEAAVKAERAGAEAYAHLLAAYERLREQAAERGAGAEAKRWTEEKASALRRARERFPEEDWRFAEGPGFTR